MDPNNIETKLEAGVINFMRTLPRMGWWLGAAIIGLIIIWIIAPQMVKVTIYKLSLVPAAAWVMYHVDLAISEHTRPHELIERAEALRAEAAAMEGGSETVDYHAKLRAAENLEAWALHRYKRRTWLVAAGLIAVSVGS